LQKSKTIISIIHFIYTRSLESVHLKLWKCSHMVLSLHTDKYFWYYVTFLTKKQSILFSIST